ncbi:MAG: 50S ribosomal protein L19 [Patescibacteria group bacterium]
MTITLDAKTLSPVNVEERKNLGIRAGDTVRVHQKIQEKGKTRIQIFEGLVIARKHGSEAGATFTVRATLSGVGVEKIFPLYSPLIDRIEIARRSKVRRAKLYYIREKVAREIRRQLRNMRMVSLSTESEREVAERAEKEAADAAATLQAEAEAKALAEKEAAEKEAAAAAPAPVEPTPEVAEENKEA